MRGFLWNILLAIAWASLTEQFTPGNLFVGFVLGYLILVFAKPLVGQTGFGYTGKIRTVVGFLLYFLWEVVLANLRVAYAVMKPAQYMRPGVVAVPLEASTDAEITVLANCITLTPGTLSVDISEDRKVLYIHSLSIQSPEVVRQEIKNGLERRVLEVLR